MSEVNETSLPSGTGLLQLLAWWRQNKQQVSNLLDLAKQYGAITDPISTDAGFKARVKLSLQLAAAMADLSGNSVAEGAVETVSKILDNDALLGVIEKLVAPFIAGAPAQAAPQPTPGSVNTLSLAPFDAYEFEAAGVDWLKLVNEILPLVIEIVQDLAGMATAK